MKASVNSKVKVYIHINIFENPISLYNVKSKKHLDMYKVQAKTIVIKKELVIMTS